MVSYVLQISSSSSLFLYISNGGSKRIDFPEAIVLDQVVLTRRLQSIAFELHDAYLLTLERIFLGIIKFLGWRRLKYGNEDFVVLCRQHAHVEYVIVLNTELSKEGFVNEAALAILEDVVINCVV